MRFLYGRQALPQLNSSDFIYVLYSKKSRRAALKAARLYRLIMLNREYVPSFFDYADIFSDEYAAAAG